MINWIRKISALILVLFALFSSSIVMSGCDSDVENAAEDTVDTVEDAADDAGDEIEDAADEMG
jgi:outer membrane murein-binding lipoprotein Lpp